LVELVLQPMLALSMLFYLVVTCGTFWAELWLMFLLLKALVWLLIGCSGLHWKTWRNSWCHSRKEN
jgi:hypothetical protein